MALTAEQRKERAKKAALILWRRRAGKDDNWEEDKDVEWRFWSKVKKTPSCWLWIGSKDKKGYGNFRVDGKLTKTHRFSWQLANGAIPTGMHVLHNCPGGDNPSCINPEHLWLGTDEDNSKDRSKKKRHGTWTKPETRVRGERNGNAKLTADNVLYIRSLYRDGGITQNDIAVMFGVAGPSVNKIIKGQRWGHISQ